MRGRLVRSMLGRPVGVELEGSLAEVQLNWTRRIPGRRLGPVLRMKQRRKRIRRNRWRRLFWRPRGGAAR